MMFPNNRLNELSNELFQSPSAEYRGLPFWSWNCKLNKETVDEQLAIFKEMGFGGVVIHPRDGLDTEYLGAEYMDVIKYAVKRCGEMGFICWLYDDDRFPSGAADGLVTKNPRFRARQLRLTKERLAENYYDSKMEFDEAINKGEIPCGYYCSAYSIEMENKKLKRYRRLRTESEISDALKNHENVRYAYLELAKEEEWFQGQTYSDTMNPEAVEEFIKVTHEQYKRVLGKDFGTVASAIFTDEPRIGKQGPITVAESEEDVFIPYTDYFAEQFQAKHGFEALDIIPEYIWDRQDGDMHGRYIYHEMKTECFSGAFMDKICSWCNENGILMTGHILGEETLRAQTTTVGDAMRTYKNMDIPGVDILIDGRELSTIRQAASVAAQYGREAVMSELYGVTNWDCTFKTYKLQGDWQAALGITIRIPHLSHMSLEGEAKRDWPASIFYQSPWYQEYSYIEDHFARLNTVLTRGRRVTRIAVVHPVESMWIKEGPTDLNGEIRKSLNKDFAQLADWLLYNTLDFDYLSESLLAEQCEAYQGGRMLKVGKAAYDVVIVPNMVTIRGTTLAVLEHFAENDGNVIFLGDIPQLVCGSKSTRGMELAEKCICIPNTREALLGEVEYLRDVEIKYDNGIPADNLFYQLREDNDCKWLFISHANKSDSVDKENYTVKIKGEYALVLYDTMTGKRCSVPSRLEDGCTLFTWSCCSEDSILLKLCKLVIDSVENEDSQKCGMTKKQETAEKHVITESYRIVQKVEEIKSFNRTEPNVLLLDYVRFSVDDGEIQDREEILRADNKIRKQLGFTQRTGMDRQPWATKTTEAHKVTLYYDIYSEMDTPMQLGIENPHKCNITLNGVEVDRTVRGWYVDKAIKVIELPDMKTGKNELKINIRYNQKTMLENLYLLGDFDVKLEGNQAIITQKSDQLHFGDITKQGMPFYTGNLEYLFEIDVKEEEEYCICIPQFAAPVIGVHVDGMKQGVIAYAPHRLSLGELDCGKHEVKVTLYGNRYNGFGTLHNANENYVWYGNGSYRTTGAEWTDDYMLRPVGIMAEIELLKL